MGRGDRRRHARAEADSPGVGRRQLENRSGHGDREGDGQDEAAKAGHARTQHGRTALHGPVRRTWLEDGHIGLAGCGAGRVERVTRIELALSAWEVERTLLAR